MLFKATAKRSTRQILNHLEVVGGDLNAYTSKEYTCLHASFLKQHLPRAVDLFADIAFSSVFPEAEVEKEKGVILDEIASYLDQPDEAIQDDFEEVLFGNHPLGRNILGTQQSVGLMSRTDMLQCMANNYDTSQLVFAVLGDYDFKTLVNLCHKYFGHITPNNPSRQRLIPPVLPGQFKRVTKPIAQTHGVIGCQAYAAHNPQKYTLLLLNNLLGGMGMSSRLNLQIREKHGIAYQIESNYSLLSDTGIFTIYFGTDTEKAPKAISLINKELKKLRDQKLGTLQLQQAKQKFNGQIALGEENRIGLIIAMAKSLLDYGEIDPLEVVFARINAVTADELLHTANQILDPLQLNTLLFEPE